MNVCRAWQLPTAAQQKVNKWIEPQHQGPPKKNTNTKQSLPKRPQGVTLYELFGDYMTLCKTRKVIIVLHSICILH